MELRILWCVCLKSSVLLTCELHASGRMMIKKNGKRKKLPALFNINFGRDGRFLVLTADKERRRKEKQCSIIVHRVSQN